jgi:hypothetical protein
MELDYLTSIVVTYSAEKKLAEIYINGELFNKEFLTFDFKCDN